MQLIPAFKIGVLNAWIFSVIFFILPFIIMLFNKETHGRGGNPPGMSTREKAISYIATIIIYIVYLYSIFLPFKLESAWFYIGFVIFLVALFILIAALVNFMTTQKDKPVTKGMYRFSRHPLYFANFLSLISIGIVAASWVILFVSVIFFILMYIDTGSEERWCKEKYGNAYEEYFNKTPKWIGIPKP